MKNKNIYSVFIVGTSTFFAGIFSYLYHPVMVRYLDIKEFAEFESLLGVINLLGVLTSGLSLFLVKEFTKLNEKKSKIIFLEITKKIGFFIGIFFSFLFIIFSGFLFSFLKIDNYFLIFIIGLMLFFGNIGMYQLIIFQGEKRFNLISLTNILNPILRLLFGIILIFIGFSLYGAIGGLLLNQITLLLFGYFILKNNFKSEKILENEQKVLKSKMKKDFLKQKKQILHFTFSTVILALFMNIDILIAKNFFEAEKAGIYAGISIIAKFLVFIGMSIETVYYPVFVSEKNIDKKKILLLSLLYIFITIFAILFFYLFGEKILHIFKPGFEKYLDLLYLLLVYCGILSILNFLVKILIAFKKYFINYLLSVTFIIFLVFLYKFTNNSFYNFVNIFNIFILISLVLSFTYLSLVKNEK